MGTPKQYVENRPYKTFPNESLSRERVLRKTEIIERTFTTEPKTRRITWHKQQTVKTRASALQESFYPTTDVLYSAVQKRMATLLGIVDRKSVLAYLGRPQITTRNEVDQEVTYLKSNTRVNKRHTFLRKLPAIKGYIELFGLGYCYTTNDDWLIHWNHVVQTALLPQSEGVEQKASIENISPPYIPQGKECEKTVLEVVSPIETIEKRESVLKRERNCESESILKPEELRILKASAHVDEEGG